MPASEKAQLLPDTELWIIRALRARTGEAIGGETNIYACIPELIKRERCVLKIIVAARAMHHAGARRAQKVGVSRREVIHVDSNETGLKEAIFMSEFHRRTFATVGHVSLAFQPIIKGTGTIGEHTKLIFRFREVRGDRKVLLDSVGSSFADQFGGC